jgi:hypothetical protein
MPVEARYIQQLTEHIDRLLPDAPERAEAVLRALIKQRCPRVARDTFFAWVVVFMAAMGALWIDDVLDREAAEAPYVRMVVRPAGDTVIYMAQAKGGMVYIINRREISTAEAKAILAEPHWQEQLRADFLWTPSGPAVAAPDS